VTRSFVQPDPGRRTLENLPPSSRADIERMARAAGLDLPEPLLTELCTAWPAFEAMVRRLPRARSRFDEPAHHLVAPHRVAILEPATQAGANTGEPRA
jgi:hypothetical protein